MPSHQPFRNMSMPCPLKFYVQNGSWRDQSWFLISLIISIKRTYSGEEVFLQLEHFNELWNEVQDRLAKILYILFIYTAFKIDYSNSTVKISFKIVRTISSIILAWELPLVYWKGNLWTCFELQTSFFITTCIIPV